MLLDEVKNDRGLLLLLLRRYIINITRAGPRMHEAFHLCVDNYKMIIRL